MPVCIKSWFYLKKIVTLHSSLSMTTKLPVNMWVEVAKLGNMAFSAFAACSVFIPQSTGPKH